ncbi:MAG: 3-dehydroquinate synthase [Planctomycetota bacterium]|nr:MAG: 3-dehydroquinate synthase [Planctomycetota bacterium]
MAATVVRVELAERAYEIAIGPGVLASCGAALGSAGARRAVIIADAGVLSTHADAVDASLRHAGIETMTIPVQRGEASKSVTEAARLWEALATANVDRATHVVAVGGGVVGDLAGFIAATFARGLPVWQVPTTLVAQVDSAIGGKTGINLHGGKNLVGAFWQPRGVLADTRTLATLPEREYVSGLAEVVKYGMILDAALFERLELRATEILAREPADVEAIVVRSATLKASVVSRDEHERTGLRAILNYGHTFGHAYENAVGYGTLLHGEAVAIGMTDAAELAVRLGRIPAEIARRQNALLTALHLPVRLPSGPRPSPQELVALMARDKKTLHGRLRFILSKQLGEVELVEGIEPSVVLDVLARIP